MTSGTGIFFDGNSAIRQNVTVELTATALIVRSVAGEQLVHWPYAELDHLVAPDQVLRLSSGASLARLEIHDPVFAAILD